MNNKTTKKQFEKFKEFCEHYADVFQLREYKFYYSHIPLNGIYAGSHTKREGKVAHIKFNLYLDDVGKRNFDDEKELKNLARHEMLHVLVGVVGELSHERYVTETQVIEAEETLIRKLDFILESSNI